MPVWHRHPGPSVAVWSMVSAEWAFVEAPVGQSTHAGVWGFDQPRRRGSSRAQFGFVQLLSVIGVLGEMPTLWPWLRGASAHFVVLWPGDPGRPGSEYAGLVLFGRACETRTMVEEADGWDSGRPGSEYAGLVLFGCARETCATVEQVDGWVWNV